MSTGVGFGVGIEDCVDRMLGIAAEYSKCIFILLTLHGMGIIRVYRMRSLTFYGLSRYSEIWMGSQNDHLYLVTL